jgi:hypothetical protein
MKTAPVSADAAAQLLPAATADLARTISRPTAELARWVHCEQCCAHTASFKNGTVNNDR